MVKGLGASTSSLERILEVGVKRDQREAAMAAFDLKPKKDGEVGRFKPIPGHSASTY